ncbi:hypothetical protein A500_10939 [Clostridium sartagoforme AAU1]|uniref:Transposase n=2 Tax=Clostridium sartagoforme TaxID=84031 RepID=R9CD20_9CLOT|nr:hypothetical protein A500_10939 [Clostridium sartagoforme AAU1]
MILENNYNKKYSDEIKLKVVREVKQWRRLAEVAGEIGCSVTSINNGV